MKLSLIYISLLLLTAVPVRAEVIDVATSTYCPLACEQDKIPHDGIMHEILRRAFAGTDHTLRFTYMPYSRAIQETLDGIHDVVTFAGTAHTPDFVFVRNMDMINVIYFAKLKSLDWKFKGAESLRTIRVSIPAGFRTGNTTIDDYLDTHHEDSVMVKETSCTSPTKAQKMNIQCLLEGRIDAMLVGTLAFRYITRGLEGADKVHLDPTPVAMFYNRIAFSPKHPKAEALRDVVENKIREMRASGELGAILNYYGAKP